MPNSKLLTLLLLLSAIVFSGCDKDKDDPEPTRTDLLAAGTWEGFGIYYAGQNLTQDFADEGYDIRKYSLRFEKNGYYTEIYDGTSNAGRWEFSSNEQSIILNKGNPNEITVNVLKLDTQELYIDYTVEISGNEYVLEERFKLKP